MLNGRIAIDCPILHMYNLRATEGWGFAWSHTLSLWQKVSCYSMCCFFKCCSLPAVPTLLYAERSRAFKAGHQRKLEPKKWDCSSINTHFRYLPRGPLEVNRYQNKAQDRTGLTSGKMLILNWGSLGRDIQLPHLWDTGACWALIKRSRIYKPASALT